LSSVADLSFDYGSTQTQEDIKGLPIMGKARKVPFLRAPLGLGVDHGDIMA